MNTFWGIIAIIIACWLLRLTYNAKSQISKQKRILINTGCFLIIIIGFITCFRIISDAYSALFTGIYYGVSTRNEYKKGDITFRSPLFYDITCRGYGLSFLGLLYGILRLLNLLP